MLPRKDDWGILRLQNCILSIAKYIHDICERNNVKYCLMGGSALGAVRHNGFIPWDDDLDIFMRPDDYSRFREIFNYEGDKDNYYLQEWGLCDGMVTLAKLRYNKSTLIEKDLEDWKINHGVYVDIFILHDCPDNKLQRFNQYLWAKYLVAKGAANRDYNRKKGIVGFGIKILKLFPKRFLLRFALRQIYKYDNYDSDYFCHFLGRAGLTTGLYKKEYFESVKEMKFESITLCVPLKVEKYLSDRWGNYMQLPSMDEIKHFQHSWKWSDSEFFPGKRADNTYIDEINLLT